MILMAGPGSAASFGKRLEALALGSVLFVGTLGVGWIIWSLFEWGSGRTPSYQLLGLRVVRVSDGQPIGLGKSIARSGICGLLLLPTIAVCCVIGICFVLGASAPAGMLRDPRRAPWDRLTATNVIDERTGPWVGGEFAPVLEPVDLASAPRASGARYN